MRDHTYVPFIIISAYRDQFSLDANRARTRELEQDLRCIRPAKVSRAGGALQGRTRAVIYYLSCPNW